MPVPPDWCKQLKELVKTTWDPFQWDKQFDRFVLTEHAASWDFFLDWLTELKGSWGFRGQREAWWLLDTSLDLAVKKETSFGYYHFDRKIEERELLFRFRQQAHQYIANPPSN